VSVPQASEPAETRLKRLGMRSWRRGTKEMDLILGPYADARLSLMDTAALTAYEALLSENDQDLYAWVTGQVAPPAEHLGVISALRAFHSITLG